MKGSRTERPNLFDLHEKLINLDDRVQGVQDLALENASALRGLTKQVNILSKEMNKEFMRIDERFDEMYTKLDEILNRLPE